MRRVFIVIAAATCLGAGCAAEPAAKDKGKKHPANRLAKESSPYLLQHAHNPVDWYPWGEEAFAKAKKEGKLIFLSIGYSSCHWCHVMERESFQNEAIAKVLNEHFVAVKIDREERPDVDDVYMTALHVMGQQGGWPLSMFLTPDGKPIVGGTYFPPDDREIGGRTVNGFKTVLQIMNRLWKDKPEEVRQQADYYAEATAKALDRASRGLALVEPKRELITAAAEEFAEAIDPEHGGVGRRERGFEGTKFPMPAAIGFLLQQAQDRKDEKLKKLVDLTLDRMARGGIYDQIGGGFHRYSTERTWTVPHFEKMLYDNAQLVELYARAFRADPNPLYRRVIEETLAFVEREMTSPQGAFYSALDADSEGEEGRFYVWTTDELNQATGALPGEEAKLFRLAFGGLDEPNFEEKYHILTRRLTDAEVAKETGMPPDAVREKLRAAREKLREVRSKRERPFLDTKVLTAWNGLMIGGYATAGEVLKQPAYIEKAKRAAEFVLKNLRTGDGRLLRTYATGPDGKGVARLNAYLDDYALLIHGLLNLHDATGEQRWLREARALADIMIKWHADEKRGGFYYTSHDHEKLFARTKDHFDGAQPSGNSMAALGLVRLWRKTGEERYREPAARSFKLFAGMLESEPQGMSALAAALDVYLDAAEKADGPEPPKKPLGADPGPRKSDAVVKVTAEAGKAAEGGKQPLTVTITIDKPWHIYANPVGSKILEGADTVVEVRSGGKKLPAEVEYPKGQKVEDPNVGDYFIYGGKVTVKAVVTRAEGDKGPLEVRVWLQACTDAGCLLPAEVKVPVK